MAHTLTEMIDEAAKLHRAEIERIIMTVEVCMDCRVAPIEVIHRPPTFELTMLGDESVLDIGYPLANPFTQSNDLRLRITEIVKLLCLECSQRRGHL